MTKNQARFPQSLPAATHPSLTSVYGFAEGQALGTRSATPSCAVTLKHRNTFVGESDLGLSDRLIAAGGAHHAVGMLRLPCGDKPDRQWATLELVPIGSQTSGAGRCQISKRSPPLLFGLVREESGFDADVDSWAGARGLSQCMKSTARMVARKHRVAGWSWAKMREPR